MIDCNRILQTMNKAYPRTCKICALGPCKKPALDSSTLTEIKVDTNLNRIRANKIRENLDKLSQELAKKDNQSGARAAFVLSSITDDDALLYLERLFKL